MIQRVLPFALLFISSLALRAQNTITTQALGITSICPGSTLNVPFTRTGTYGANNTFTVQLSDGGDYKNIETGAISLNSNTGVYTVPVTIPANQAAGTTYTLRVNASNPAVVGTPSATKLTVKTKPTPPNGQSPQYDCQYRFRSGNLGSELYYSTIELTGLIPGSVIVFYDVNNKKIDFTSDQFGNSNSTSRSFKSPAFENRDPGSKDYYVTQSVDGCESEKKLIQLIVKPKAESGPKVTTSESAYVVGSNQDAAAGVVRLCQGSNPISFGDLPIQAQEGYSIGYCEITINRNIGGNGAACDNLTPISNSTPIETTLTGKRLFRLSSRPNNPNTNCANNLSSDTYILIDVVPRPTKPTVPTSTISLCQFQQASPVAASATNGASLVWYGTNAIGGTGSNAPTLPATDKAGTFKYYVAQKLNDCESERTEITVEVKAASPAPTVSAVNYCQGAPASQLSAVAASGGSLTWYTAPAGGTALPGAPTPSTSSTGTITYYVSQTLSGSCESQRVALPVTVSATPPAPTVNNTSLCQFSTPQPLTAVGQNLKWYEAASGGNTSSSITPNTSAVGSKSYYVSQTVNNCEGPRTAVSVTIKEAPAAPSVPEAQYSFCFGSSNSVIKANLNSQADTYTWYGNGGQPVLTNVSNAGNTLTATVPTNQTGTFTYWVTRTNNGCESPASQPIKVTINSVPQAPATSSVAVCQNATAPVLQSSGQNLLWYTSNTGGTSSTSPPVVITSQTGQTTYYVSQSVNNCESSRSALSITVNAIPGVPTVATTSAAYCQNANATSLTATGQGLRWYRESSGGTSLGANPIPETKEAGSFTYYVSQMVNECESGRSSVTVKVSAAPTAPSVTGAYSFCQKAPAPALTAAGTGLKWYDSNNRGIDAPTPSTDTPGTVSYFVSQSVDGCEGTRAEIKVTTKQTPGAPATAAFVACQNESAQPLSVSGQNLLWYTTETGGTGSATTPAVNTGQPTQLTYYVSQSVDGCEGPRTGLAVKVKPLPPAPGVAQKDICQFSKAEPLTAQGNDLRWYYPDDKPVGSTPTPPTDKGATYPYKVSQVADGCEGPKATLTVNILMTPAPTVARTTVELCVAGASPPLQATGTNLKWTDPAGNVSTTAPTPPTLNATFRPEGDIFYVTQTGANGCESPRVAISVFVQTAPTLSILGTTTTNLGIEIPLKLTFTGVGPYRYKLSDGSAGTTVKDTTIMVMPTRSTTYQVVEVANKCGVGLPGSNATATVTVNIPTIQTLAFATTTVCAGSSLSTNFTTSGSFNPGSVFRLQYARVETDTTKITFADLTGSQTTNGTIAGVLPPNVPSGTYWVRVMATNPKIPILGTNSPTLLTVRSQATATLTGPPTIFEGQAGNLTVTFTGDGPWSFTYQDSTALGLGVAQTIQTTTNPHLVEVRPTKTARYLLTAVSNSCGPGTRTGSSIVVNVAPLLGIEDQLLAEAVDIFPVPTTTTLTVRIRGLTAKQPAMLELTDLTGHIRVRQESRRETTVLSLDQQPAGTYILHIRVGDRSTSKRILKL